MDADSQRLRAKVATLNNSLHDLEIFVGLDTIQQAKLQVALPYLVYDLVFNHPVISELDRIRQYFDKIKNAEDPRRAQRPPGDEQGPSHIRFGEGGQPTKVPVKMTSKMVARAQYEKELAEAESEEEEGLEVIDVEEVPNNMDIDVSTTAKDKGKGKAVDNDDAEPSSAGRKRRRPAMDPFAGMQATEMTTHPLLHRRKEGEAGLEGGRSTPLSSSDAAKKAKKAEKKARKKAKRKESIG
ncbi:uncharacterized protein B0H18DRAFT_1084096 [Fomitopsis serialis]|uniref:uncharacterized protein n=1 Tax=Fomitopsis serialis TaxID=139415 RepID=UPI0020080FA0|nr:uncharacterized protein B0H18DRAFT_1084096 [Neoantrodia serialis]KAH9929754.1 hypothetical protein B0H18DRAFT_1084096 [Neoantrodia serialis]